MLNCFTHPVLFTEVTVLNLTPIAFGAPFEIIAVENLSAVAFVVLELTFWRS